MAIHTAAPLILVVDDYRDAREMYSHYLAGCGFRVAEAKNGLEAFEKATAYRPDVVLIDLYLPGLDGWELARRLKEDARTRGAILVAFTAHSSADAASRARDAGCAMFLVKPCLGDTLLKEIKRLLATERVSSESRAATRPRSTASAMAADEPKRGKSGSASEPAGETEPI